MDKEQLVDETQLTEEQGLINLAKIRLDHSGHGDDTEKHSHHRSHRHHRVSVGQVARWLLLLVLMLLLGAGAGLTSLYFTGRSSLQTSAEEIAGITMTSDAETLPAEAQDGSQNGLPEELQSAALEDLPAGTIRHQGNYYRYRENNVNILFIGVDSSGTNEHQVVQGGGNGQSDVIVLANLNTDDGKITLIPVNRDTMTQIAVRNANGEFLRYEEDQLAVSYAYGNDKDDSARLTMEAVSNLFYGLPIQGYFTLTIDGITQINNLVGGVDVVLQEDFVNEWGDGYNKGATVHLQNSMAEDYIRARSGKTDGTNAMRMERQKSYLLALAKKVLAASEKTPTLPVKLYQETEHYRSTDIGLNEFTYLAGQVIQCGFSEEYVRKVEGTLNYEHEYAEFYTDDQALYDLILDVFYERL